MLALAIEDCNLHRRIALYVLSIVGTSPRLLLLGFMLSTALLSMWISNTAACAMMIPILDAILEEVLSVATDPEDPEPKISGKNMRAMLCMSVTLAANIGGTATTIGNNEFVKKKIKNLKFFLIISKLKGTTFHLF
jgi:sodium-dependent dicarboxylate transporter 2/3/5